LQAGRNSLEVREFPLLLMNQLNARLDCGVSSFFLVGFVAFRIHRDLIFFLIRQ